MPWIYLDDHFPEHPKVIRAGGDAGWLFVCILGYCRRHGTGGRIPKAAALRVSDRKNPAAVLRRMVEIELLVDAGEFYDVHNYDEWNRPQESRTEAARKAAKARWSKGKPSDASSNANASESHGERMSEPDASTCPMPLAPAPTEEPLSSGTVVADRPPDDEIVTAAIEALARRDLERVTAEQGPRGDDERWLRTARRRRLNQYGDRAYALLEAEPTLTAAELAERLEPSTKPHPLDEAHQAQYAAMVDLLKERPDWLVEPDPSPEEKAAVLDRVKAARRTA